jgi:hypothetical protein
MTGMIWIICLKIKWTTMSRKHGGLITCVVGLVVPSSVIGSVITSIITMGVRLLI